MLKESRADVSTHPEAGIQKSCTEEGCIGLEGAEGEVRQILFTSRCLSIEEVQWYLLMFSRGSCPKQSGTAPSGKLCPRTHAPLMPQPGQLAAMNE